MIPHRATLRTDSPRYDDFFAVFGSDTVEIESPIAHWAECPDGRMQFYKVRIAALSAEQRERFVQFAMRRFGLARLDVEEGIDGETGIPLLADDVFVTFDPRYAL